MDYMTIKEFASHISKSYITTLHLVHDGKVRGIKKGGQWVVPLEEVERFDKEGNYIDRSNEDIHV